MNTKIAFAFCLTAVAFSARTLAHHAFAAEFDSTKEVKVTRAVMKMEWQNPHIWFFVDVKGEDGTVANWGFQMASPSQLLRAGWRRDTVKPGDVVGRRQPRSVIDRFITTRFRRPRAERERRRRGGERAWDYWRTGWPGAHGPNPSLVGREPNCRVVVPLTATFAKNDTATRFQDEDRAAP